MSKAKVVTGLDGAPGEGPGNAIRTLSFQSASIAPLQARWGEAALLKTLAHTGTCSIEL